MELTPQEKAQELFDRMNGQKVSINVWINATEYAQLDLRRKVKIVVDEVLDQIPMYIGNLNPKWKYWNEVRKRVKNFEPIEK